MIKIMQLIMTSDNSIVLPAEQFKPEELLACFCEMDHKWKTYFQRYRNKLYIDF